MFYKPHAMTKKDKIAFIKAGDHKTYSHDELAKMTDQQLNEHIREIVQILVRKSEIIASAYLSAHK